MYEVALILPLPQNIRNAQVLEGRRSSSRTRRLSAIISSLRTVSDSLRPKCYTVTSARTQDKWRLNSSKRWLFDSAWDDDSLWVCLCAWEYVCMHVCMCICLYLFVLSKHWFIHWQVPLSSSRSITFYSYPSSLITLSTLHPQPLTHYSSAHHRVKLTS